MCKKEVTNFDDLFETLGNTLAGGMFSGDPLFWTNVEQKTGKRPLWKIVETDNDDELVFEVNVVGIDPESVTVKAEGERLRIKTELGDNSSSFANVFDSTWKVPVEFKASSAKAVVKDGVLTISLGRRKTAKIKEIEVEY